MNIKIYQIYQTNAENQVNGNITLMTYDDKGNGAAIFAIDKEIKTAKMDHWICEDAPDNQRWVFNPKADGRRNPEEYPYTNGKTAQDYKSVIDYAVSSKRAGLTKPDGGDGGSGGETGGN